MSLAVLHLTMCRMGFSSHVPANITVGRTMRVTGGFKDSRSTPFVGNILKGVTHSTRTWRLDGMCSMARVGKCVGGLFRRSFVLDHVQVQNRIDGYGCRDSNRVCFALGSRGSTVDYMVFTSSEGKLTFPVESKSEMMMSKDISMCRESNHCRVCTKSVMGRKTNVLCRQFLTLGTRLRRVNVFTPRCGRPVPKVIEAIKVIASPANTTIRSVEGVTKEEGPFIRLVLCPTLIRKRKTTRDVYQNVRALSTVRLSIVVIKEKKKSLRSL